MTRQRETIGMLVMD